MTDDRMLKAQELEAQRQLLDLTAHEGWAILVSLLQKRIEEATNRVMNSERILPVEEVEKHKGRIKELNWLLQLPDGTRINRDVLIEELEQLNQAAQAEA